MATAMADQDSKNRILQRFSELDASLSNQRKNLEQLCNLLRSLSSKQMKIWIKSDEDGDDDDEDSCISSETACETERKDEAIDFGEIDKILEKAKSLRIVEEEAEELHKCEGKGTAKITSAGPKIQAQRDKKAARLKTNPSKTAALSRSETARKRASVVSRPVQKSKGAMPLSKSSQGVRKKAAASRTSVDIKGHVSTATVKPGSTLPRDDQPVASGGKRGACSVRDMKAVDSEDKGMIEKDLSEKVVVSKDAVDYCVEIRALREKISNFMKNPSKNIVNARTEFLQAAESSFSDKCNFPETLLDSVPDHIVSFRKAARRKLKEASPALESLSSIRPQDTLVTSTEQLQRLFNTVLKLQEMMIELESKEILFQWSLKLLHSDKLTKSEKINAYRKLYGLLVNNGKSLPAMIEDSETLDCDEPQL